MCTHYKIFLPLLCLIASYGCQSKNNASDNTSVSAGDTTCIEITLDPSSPDELPFDSLITKVSFVRLETNDDCLIGYTNQIVCSDKYIYVLDRERANAIFCFDKEGHFIRQLGNTGQGPGEYVRLCNLAYRPDKEQIVAVDFYGKLLYYTEDGKYIREEQIPYTTHPFDNIEFSGDALVGFDCEGATQEEGHPMLWITDNAWKNTTRAFPSYFTPKFRYNSHILPLHKFGDKVYFQKPWSASYYVVDDNGYHEAYHVNIKNHTDLAITEDMDDEKYQNALNSMLNRSEYIFLKDYALFYFSIQGANWEPFIVYSHKTKQMYKCSGAHTNPLFVFQGTNNIPLVPYDDNSFIVHHSASIVLQLKKGLYENPDSDKKELDKLYDGLTEDDNPVLFIMHVNK